MVKPLNLHSLQRKMIDPHLHAWHVNNMKYMYHILQENIRSSNRKKNTVKLTISFNWFSFEKKVSFKDCRCIVSFDPKMIGWRRDNVYPLMKITILGKIIEKKNEQAHIPWFNIA